MLHELNGATRTLCTSSSTQLYVRVYAGKPNNIMFTNVILCLHVCKYTLTFAEYLPKGYLKWPSVGSGIFN